MTWRFNECLKCGGTLIPDGEEWVCFQCGHREYKSPLLPYAEANIEPHRKKKAWVDCVGCGVPRLVTVDPQGKPYGSGLCKGCAQRRRYKKVILKV